jgi:hypothetical protein
MHFFPTAKWLRELAAILHYTYIVYLVSTKKVFFAINMLHKAKL